MDVDHGADHLPRLRPSALNCATWRWRGPSLRRGACWRSSRVRHEFRDHLDLGERDAVVDLEVADHRAPGAGQVLGALPPDRVELRGRLDLVDQLEEVPVQGPAKALVRGDQQDAAGLHRPLHEKGMGGFLDPLRERRQDLREEVCVRPASQRELLRLLHLRRRDELHRLRDLAGVPDGPDPSADVACAGHRRLVIAGSWTAGSGRIGRLERGLLEELDDAAPRSSWAFVLASRSEPNCAKAASSRNWASSPLILPATCLWP
jgi:hypothetical protein